MSNAKTLPDPNACFELADQISRLCHGHPAMVVSSALADALARTLCFVPDDAVDGLLILQLDLVRQLRKPNLDAFRERNGYDPRTKGRAP